MKNDSFLVIVKDIYVTFRTCESGFLVALWICHPIAFSLHGFWEVISFIEVPLEGICHFPLFLKDFIMAFSTFPITSLSLSLQVIEILLLFFLRLYIQGQIQRMWKIATAVSLPRRDGWSFAGVKAGVSSPELLTSLPCATAFPGTSAVSWI